MTTIQLAPKEVHQALWGSKFRPELNKAYQNPSPMHEAVLNVIAGRKPSDILDSAINIPELDLMRSLVKAIRAGIPLYPVTGCIPPYEGWQVYVDGKWLYCPVTDLPKAAVLDFETQSVLGRWYPRVAIALGLNKDGHLAWYRYWCGVNGDRCNNRDLVPYSRDGLIVGHNVNYDSSYLEPFYQVEATLKGFCTQGLARLVYGLSRRQEDAILPIRRLQRQPAWAVNGVSSKAKEFGLAALCKRFLNLSLDKTIRDGVSEEAGDDHLSDDLSWDDPVVQPAQVAGIVDANDSDWLHDYSTYEAYCAGDVRATAMLLSFLLAQGKHIGLDPRRYAGMMLDSRQLLCVDDDWDEWIMNTDTTYLDTIQAIKDALAKHAIAYAGKKPDTLDDGLDWTPLKSGKNKNKPKWLADYLKDPGISSSVTAIVASLKVNGNPVVRRNTGEKRTQWTLAAILPDGSEAPVLSPRHGKPTASFLGTTSEPLWESGVYSSDCPELERAQSCANWVSIRKQLKKQRTVHYRGNTWIKPMGQLAGTATGRTSDTWVVLPKPKPHRIGTEVYSKVVAPNGYSRMYADVDQEENVIAALLADQYVGKGLCSNPFSLAIMIGDKAVGSDPHTIVARDVILPHMPEGTELGVARGYAKPMNYAYNYLAGIPGLMLPLLSAGLGRDLATKLSQAYLDKARGKKADGRWVGGIASEYTNAVWDNLNSPYDAKTLLFNHATPLPLRKSALNGEFVTTLANWRIQATGVDVKNVLMTVFEYLCREAYVPYQLCITEHDALTYYIKEGYEEQACVLLQTAHVVMKALLWGSVGIYEIPEVQLWFESVDCTKRRVSKIGKPVVTPSATLSDGVGLICSVSSLSKPTVYTSKHLA